MNKKRINFILIILIYFFIYLIFKKNSALSNITFLSLKIFITKVFPFLFIMMTLNNFLIKCNLPYYFNKIFIILTFYILILINNYTNYYYLQSNSEIFKSIFYGPINITENLLATFFWSFNQFYLIYLLGDFLYYQLKKINIYTIFRFNNKNKWYISIHLTLLFSCILYYILIVTICIIYMFFFHKKVHISESLEILKVSFLMFLSSYFIITLYLNLILILKKHNISYIIIICILYSSILLGNLLSIDQFLPLNRCILAKHYSLNLKYSVSYTYLTVLIIVNYLISKKNILLNDFINYLT